MAYYPLEQSEAFFESMRRQLRGQVEGQRVRASRGAESTLARRGLFGESTIAAQALAGIGGASAEALQRGETGIQQMEFQKALEEYLIKLQQPSFLEKGLGALGGGLGAVLGGPIGAGLFSKSKSGAFQNPQDPFGLLQGRG